MRRALAFLAAWLAAAAAAWAQDPSYATVPLEVGGRADAVALEDVTGDGRTDIVVQTGRDLRFFFYRPEGGFRPQHDALLRLEPNTFLWTLARLDGAAPVQVVTASSRGLHRHVPVRGQFAAKPEDLVIHPSIFEGSVSEARAPIRLDFLRDLDGDGRLDALMFARGELLALVQRPSGSGIEFVLAQRVPIPIDTGLLLHPGPHQPVREMTSIPVLAFGDVNGDGRADISYYQNEAIGVFFRHVDGRYSSQDPTSVAVRKRRTRQTYIQFDLPPTIRDLNGDRLQDLVVVYPSRGRAHVYLNRDGAIDFTNPDTVLRIADGWSTGVYVKDLDRDGRCEIVLGLVRKFGVLGGIDVFISKRIELELHVFRYDPAVHNYALTPVQELKFTIPYTFLATRESASIDLTFRPHFDADLDGDGLFDLLVEKDFQTLAIHYGQKGSMIRAEEGGTIALQPPPNTASTLPFSADFNGDGKSDLVLRYGHAEPNRHAVEVKLSK